MNDNQIKELLNEISQMTLESQIEIDKIPFENCDMEPYEGTKIEDLGNCLYISGKIDMLEEVKSLIQTMVSTNYNTTMTKTKWNQNLINNKTVE